MLFFSFLFFFTFLSRNFIPRAKLFTCSILYKVCNEHEKFSEKVQEFPKKKINKKTKSRKLI